MSLVCPNCGTKVGITESMVTSTFSYGVGKSVPLTVTEPVMHCEECDQRWTDNRGEEARAAVVNRYRAVFETARRKRVSAEATQTSGLRLLQMARREVQLAHNYYMRYMWSPTTSQPYHEKYEHHTKEFNTLMDELEELLDQK